MNYFLFLIQTQRILFEAISLRIDGVMALKPFTFDIWGKILSLLIVCYTHWKGLIYMSPMQFIQGQTIDF